MRRAEQIAVMLVDVNTEPVGVEKDAAADRTLFLDAQRIDVVLFGERRR